VEGVREEIIKGSAPGGSKSSASGGGLMPSSAGQFV